jgi:hypothetical protein
VELGSGRNCAQVSKAESEKKTIFTFLAQGAVGGAVGCFLLVAGCLLAYPGGYNILYLVFLPILLAYGAVVGAVTAIFVWLPQALFKRRLGFIMRALIATVSLMLLGFALSTWVEHREIEYWSLLLVVGLYGLITLPVALMTGASVRPCRLMVLGANRRKFGYKQRNWVGYPVGFLLRVVSVFGLLEALLTLALWISARRMGGDAIPGPERLPAIGLALLYFLASSYFSINTPRKPFLVPTAIVLNLPLGVLTLYLVHLATAESNYLAYLFLGLVGLWTLYTLARIVATDTDSGVATSDRRAPEASHISRGGAWQVQL